jgi:hypothetical protein
MHIWWPLLTQAGIPVLLFATDALVRSALGLSVIDAGSDLALAAFTGFIMLALVEHPHRRPGMAGPALLLSLLAFLLWFASLATIANIESAPGVILTVAIGTVSMTGFVWFFRDVVRVREDFDE